MGFTAQVRGVLSRPREQWGAICRSASRCAYRKLDVDWDVYNTHDYLFTHDTIVSSVSADYSGELHKRCAEAGILSLYLNGLCGDIDPWKPSPERMAGFSAKILTVLENNRRELPLTLSGTRLPFTLRLSFLSREEIRATAARAVQKAGSPEAGVARAALAWADEMLRTFDTLRAEEPGDAACCLLGGIPILALPFEGYTEIGLAFRRKTGEPDALVLGCAEKLRGYLPTADDFERQSYAAMESMFLYRRLSPLPGEAERLADQLAARCSAARPFL